MSRWRMLGDAPVDPLVTALGRDAWRLGPLLSRAPRNIDPVPAEVPTEVAAWLVRASSLPRWADPLRLERAGAFGHAHLGAIVSVLFTASLPRLFTSAKGSLVLGATGRMAEDMDKRINETGRFVLDVWAQDGFRPEGAAIRSTLRVRLLHAAVRAHLAHRPGFTDETPINQEDMLGTLLGFSIVVMDGLRRLGFPVDARHTEDVWHLFRVVGALSGVKARVLPVSVAVARAELERIEQQQATPSEQGRALAVRLLDRMQIHAARVGLGHLPRSLMSTLLGERRMGMLGLAMAAPPKALELRAFQALGTVLKPSLLELGMRTKLNGRVVDFGAPSALAR